MQKNLSSMLDRKLFLPNEVTQFEDLADTLHMLTGNSLMSAYLIMVARRPSLPLSETLITIPHPKQRAVIQLFGNINANVLKARHLKTKNRFDLSVNLILILKISQLKRVYLRSKCAI